jgi:NADH-quinone oxidoreductase subunit N
VSPFYTTVDNLAIQPALILAIFGCAVLLLEFVLGRTKAIRTRRWTLGLSLAGLAFTGRSLMTQRDAMLADAGRFTAFSGAVSVDGFALFFNWIFLAASLVTILISYRYLQIENEDRAEYYGLVLLAQCGMYFLAAGTDLVTIFIGLELMALSFYILVGFLRGEQRSNEAAMKYFLLGVFSSALLAYGFSLLFGIAGSTRLKEIGTAIQAHSLRDPVVLVALGVTSAALLFKISAVPFHMWAPDAYEGAPAPVTAFLSVGSKAASFALLLRFFLEPLSSLRDAWQPLIVAVAVLSMTAGNLAAITQRNLKRLIAYSSISHAGYILLGLVSGNETGFQGIAVYVLAYTFTNLGALLIVAALRKKHSEGLQEELGDISGLARRNPAYAAFMVVFLLSLAGLPPTAGFLGKYYIFLSLIQTGHNILAVVATLYVAVAVYYYFGIAKMMYTGEEPRGSTDTESASKGSLISSSLGVRVALGITAAATIAIGLYPEPFLRFAELSLLR